MPQPQQNLPPSPLPATDIQAESPAKITTETPKTATSAANEQTSAANEQASSANEQAKWYVMRVHNMAFNRTIAALSNTSLQYFYPETYEIITAAGRKTKQLVPALRDLIFINATVEEIDATIRRFSLPLAYYFSHTSHLQNDRLSVRPDEMDAFIRASRAYDRHPSIRPFGEITLRPGDRVRVLTGPCAGIEGHYTQPRRGMKRHLVLTLSNLLTLTLLPSPTDLLQQL